MSNNFYNKLGVYFLDAEGISDYESMFAYDNIACLIVKLGIV